MLYHTFLPILNQFQIQGEIISVEPFGSGHINGTYRVFTNSEDDYILQKINQYVFKDVTGLTQNLVYVLGHLNKKLQAMPNSNPKKELLTLIKSKHDDFFVIDDEGGFWRTFIFLKDTQSYDLVTNEKQAMEGGKAFGKFQMLLSDLDPQLLIETIPNFHHIGFRLANLDLAIKKDSLGRVNTVLNEIQFIESRREQMLQIIKLGEAGRLPLRVIHNDTKFNNVLLDENDNAQCVIDLDTVMPGYVAYDFGDAIRTIINSAPEDEPDLSKIKLNIPLFEAYTKGYMEYAASFLSEIEITSLMDGVLLLPYMQAVRFLTDYIDGDKYFKTHFEGHNLQRAKAQLQLVKLLEENKNTLVDIILRS